MKGVEEKTFDLTIGRVRQTLIQYALPLVVMNLMQSLYSMADFLISGHFIGSRGISVSYTHLLRNRKFPVKRNAGCMY